MTEKQPKAKSGLRRFAGDMVYSLAGLMILNMTLSFGVYPFLRSRMGAEGSGKMLFFTAIMGLMASAVGSGINYGRMKASTRHETKNGDYNRFLVFTALLCAIVTVVAICVKKDTAGALPISIGVLIFATTVRYYADVEYRLSLNYRGFFFYYLFIAVGYAIGMALYGISHSWVSIFILGEVFGLLFVTITGSIFKKPFFKKSQFFREDAKTCVSLSSAYLLSDFVTYTDRVVLPMTCSFRSVSAVGSNEVGHKTAGRRKAAQFPAPQPIRSWMGRAFYPGQTQYRQYPSFRRYESPAD